MKKLSVNVVPQTAVDFLGTDQRYVKYSLNLKVPFKTKNPVAIKRKKLQVLLFLGGVLSVSEKL